MKMITLKKFSVSEINYNFGLMASYLAAVTPGQLYTADGAALLTADGEHIKVGVTDTCRTM